MRAARYVANRAQGPGRQHAGVHRCIEVVDDLFNGDNATLGGQCGFFLHPENAPEQHVAFAIGFLCMDHGDVRAHRRHGGEHFAGERAGNGLDQRVDLRQVGTGVGSQHRERQAGSTGDVGIGQVGVTVLFDFQRVWPLFLDGVTQAMQGADTRVAAPGENQLAGTTGTDQLVVDQVRGHPHQGQVFLALANDFVTRGRRDQVSKAFERDRIAVVYELLHRVVQRKDFSHWGRLPFIVNRQWKKAPMRSAGMTEG
ncbi:hypothetical protein D9M71_481340 [compost metagenome]